MTAQQFLERFKLLTEVVSSYEAPGLLDAEIYDLLNLSQREIALELCVNKKFDNLYSLITQDEIFLNPELIGPLPNNSHVYKGELADNFYFPISGQIAISRSTISSTGFIPTYVMGNTIVGMKEIDVEFANNFIENPFNKNTILLNPLYWIESFGTLNKGELKVITDSYTTLGAITSIQSHPNVVFSYIKIPTDIGDTSETDMPEKLHELILSRAIDKRKQALVANANKN